MTDRTALAKILPHNPQAETSVLGAIILDNATLNTALTAGLNSREFFFRTNGIIFAAILRLRDAGTPIDLVTLADSLERSSELEQAGGGAYIAQLIDGVPRTSNIEHYVRLVKEKARLRTLIHLGEAIQNSAFGAGSQDVSTIEDQLRAGLAAAIPYTDGNGKGGPPPARSIIDLLNANFPKAEELIQGLVIRASSGLFFAKPHRLKSWLTLALTMRATREGYILGGKLLVERPVRTLLFSLEDPPGQVRDRVHSLVDRPAYKDIEQERCRIITRDQVREYPGHPEIGPFHLPHPLWHDYVLREAERLKADHIILDVLRKIARPGLDVNKPSDAAEMVREFELLHDQTGATITACHHQKKGDGGEIMDSAVGSQAFVSWSKMVVRFDHKTEEKTSTGKITSVELETDNAFNSCLDPMRLVLDLAADDPLRLEGIEEGTGMRRAEERLAHEWTKRDLQESDEISAATAWRRIDAWLESGRIEKVQDAKPTKGGMARYRFKIKPLLDPANVPTPIRRI